MRARMWYNFSCRDEQKTGALLFFKSRHYHNFKLWAKRPLCVDSRPACSSRQRRQAHKGRFVMSGKSQFSYGHCSSCQKYPASLYPDGNHYCPRCLPEPLPEHRMNKRRKVQTCPGCQKEFTTSGTHQIYCSKECQKINTPTPEDQNTRNRFIIFDRDGFQCIYCGSTSYGDGVELTLDHIIPHSKGGSDCAENLVTACRGCNSAKNDRFMVSTSLIVLEIKRRNKWAGISPKLAIRFNKALGEPDEQENLEATQLSIDIS